MPNQRFYIWSGEADGCALAWRLKQEGYDVVLRIEELWMRSNLDGIIEKTSRMPRISDIIVFDGVGHGERARELANSSFAVIGSSVLADELELDRAKAMQMLVDLGIKIPETQKCASISEAIDLVEQEQGRWVFKPSGNEECASTYVARDELDMIEMLLHFQASLGDNVESIMQRKLEGPCISTEGWWDGEAWIEGAFNSTFECKDWLVGNCGPKTGCEWCVVWPYSSVPELAMQLHEKLSSLLIEDTYIGPIDFNSIITPEGPHVLEITPRFGYDAIEALCAIMQRSLGETLIALVEQNHLWLIAEDEIGLSLRLSIKPYPFANTDYPASGDIPIRFRHEDIGKLWLTGVRQVKRKLVSSPTDGVIGILATSAKQEQMWNAGSELREAARRMMVPDLQWRDDPGSAVFDEWHKLAALGYATPLGQQFGLAEIAQPASISY